MKILVTGGAGYLGSILSLALIEEGHDVRVLDNLMYGGRALLSMFGHSRFELTAGDIRDSSAVERALANIDAVVHLAAIVGDPACARDPEAARAINEHGSLGVVRAAQAAGVGRFVFASTCSNYGRMSDTSVLATEDHDLRPLSLYAETKVAVERELLGAGAASMAGTVLRFATLFGVSPRMRFDLTVNQFVMEMLAHRKLVVYGERFWRPYVHVRDAARAIMTVLSAPVDVVRSQVFNVGHTDENYRKVDLVGIIGRRVSGATVEFVSVADDPRDYKVSFERIRSTLGFVPTRRVADGIEEVARVIETGVLGKVEDAAYSNIGERAPSGAIAAPGTPICVP
ncbi:MAG: NAD-dependent epimerase/dehydratase family protein [Luteitalea sp.]|nr:NAD-dependent epimerase/dehydratase family protein [Luteitalea sp.]